MKKVLSILLSCTIITSLLIGCSSDDDKKYNELAQKIEELEKENEKLKEEKEDEGELEEKNKKSNIGNENEEDDELGEFEKRR